MHAWESIQQVIDHIEENLTKELPIKKMADIAVEYQFSSHGNYTRAFKKAFGITPEEMRHVKTMMNQYVKPNLLLNYVMVDEDVPLMAEGIVLGVTRKKLERSIPIVGITKEIPIVDIMGGQDSGVSITGEMWSSFHNIKPNIPNLLPAGRECGVVYSGEVKQGYCMYHAGSEALGKCSQDTLSIFNIPAREYIVCGTAP